MSGYGVCFLMMLGLAYGSPTGCKEYEYQFYTKADWDAKPVTAVLPLKTPTPYVVIHHTYIPEICYTPDTCKASMRSMQKYHQSLGWDDIGYNFCVGGEGGAYEGRGWEVLGIHAGKANNYSIGICLIGDFRTELPPCEQLETTRTLIELGVEKGFIREDYKLIAHRQAMATECPGDALYAHVQKWKHYVPEFVVPDD